MHPDASKPPASPATHARWSPLLCWVALGLLGWVVVAGLALVVYLTVTLVT